MSLVIKAFLKDEIRRIRVPSSSSFGEIELQLRTALAIPSATRITIKYQDEEGDHCVLSPESLTDALSIATAAANHETTPLLKVHITPTSTAPTTTTLATPTVSSATAGMNMLQLELTSDTDKSEIKEWHFHVVFLWSNAEQVRQAEALREKIVAAVASGDLTVVCHGVTTEHFPKLNMNRVPKVNLKPIGPHISGSYEVWVPKEGFVTAMSFFTLNRGDVSILIHPLTRWELADHSTRASWIGTQFPLDLGPLVEDLNRIPFQYPDLGLGYSKKQ